MLNIHERFPILIPQSFLPKKENVNELSEKGKEKRRERSSDCRNTDPTERQLGPGSKV